MSKLLLSVPGLGHWLDIIIGASPERLKSKKIVQYSSEAVNWLGPLWSHIDYLRREFLFCKQRRNAPFSFACEDAGRVQETPLVGE